MYEPPSSYEASIAWGKIIGGLIMAAILTIWGWQLLTQQQPFIPLDYVNSGIHEWSAVFYDFGGIVFICFMQNLVQVVIPLLFAFYFFYTKQALGFAFSLFWSGDYLIQVGIYMADAVKMRLNICSLWYFECGDSSLHDWHIIFSAWGLLPESQAIGNFTRFIGSAVLIFSLAYLYLYIFRLRDKTVVHKDFIA
jgi:hypothetical protein